MSAASVPRTTRAGAPLVLVASAALVVFYYLARVDAIGVFSPARGWHAMTAAPRPWLVHFGAAALLLGVLPVAVARWYAGFRLADLGLGVGRWREGLAWLAVGLPLAVVAGKVGSLSPVMRAVYPLDPTVGRGIEFVGYALGAFLYFGAWEVLFRGVLLFGLRSHVGSAVANATQAGLSVTAHFGRALAETAAALPAGLAFGWVSLRVGSVWYVGLIHWTVGMSTEWFLLGG